MKFDLYKENINYIKITYHDKDEFKHCIKAAIRFISETEILVSAKLDEKIFIPVPQDAELGIACDNGLYKTKAVLKRIEYENPYTLFSLKKPQEMDYQQNREYFRVKLQESASITYEKNEEQKQISVLTYDISAKGVCIELDEQVDFPEEVILSLFFPDKKIEVKGKYVRTDVEDNIIKASFQFDDIPQADLDYISQICFKKQLEERRKNLLG